MMEVVIHVGAVLTGLWGIAHLFATRGVVAGFGELTADNRRIITMEWIIEGIALIAVAGFVTVVTAMDSPVTISTAVYAVAVATLLAFALVSVFTGFRVAFLPFRLCPIIFVVSAALIAVGAWV